MRTNSFGMRSNEVNDFKLFSFRYAFTKNIPININSINGNIPININSINGDKY